MRLLCAHPFDFCIYADRADEVSSRRILFLLKDRVFAPGYHDRDRVLVFRALYDAPPPPDYAVRVPSVLVYSFDIVPALLQYRLLTVTDFMRALLAYSVANAMFKPLLRIPSLWRGNYPVVLLEKKYADLYIPNYDKVWNGRCRTLPIKQTLDFSSVVMRTEAFPEAREKLEEFEEYLTGLSESVGICEIDF